LQGKAGRGKAWDDRILAGQVQALHGKARRVKAWVDTLCVMQDIPNIHLAGERLMLTLTTPNGKQVRTHMDEAGVIWWVAKDVGDALGIAEVRSTIRGFPDDENTGHVLPGINGVHTMHAMLNEPGLYRLIFISRKPEAEAFKRWVFHDVLPTLRQTGTYTMPGVTPTPTARPAQERVGISTHLLAVWRVLRKNEEPLTNREIAHQAGVAERTARAHTKYLMGLGLLDLFETFPRHLYAISSQANKGDAYHWQRLERISEIVERRQARFLE
jgi:prophage antirepressor-like protein